MSEIFEMKNNLRGDLIIPGDKSVTHRAVILGALAEGVTRIRHYLNADDCRNTINIIRHLSINVEEEEPGVLLVHGNGLYGLRKPPHVLNAGNSTTTIRLLSGVLAAQRFSSELSADASVMQKPMREILFPLQSMGANVASKKGNDCVPFLIRPSKIKGILYNSPIASTQIKSSILFAALFGDKETIIKEPYPSRNHTEHLLEAFGVSVDEGYYSTRLCPPKKLQAADIYVPGDISSAAYLITAALITKGSEIMLRGVDMNPTRNGFIDAVKSMGADIEVITHSEQGPAMADLLVRSSNLRGVTLEGSIIPRVLDEIPILMVLACFAQGRTVIRDAGELQVKESGRLEIMAQYLNRMGARVSLTDDGIIVDGGTPMHGIIIGTKYDHRIAMSFAIAALASSGKTEIIGSECVGVSYPHFYETLKSLFTV